MTDVIDQVKQRLVARGLTIVQNIPTPSTDKQIVLLDAPRLRQLRTIYAFADPLAQWLIVFVAALYLVALLLSRRRPRMMVTIGLLLAANALLLALALAIGRQLFIDDFAGTALGPASAVFYDTLLGYLQRGWHVLLWLGVIVVLTGWFTGSSTAGQKTRAAVRDGLEKVGAGCPARESALPAVGSRPTPTGYAPPPGCWAPSSCCGVTSRPRGGCCGRSDSCWSCCSPCRS